MCQPVTGVEPSEEGSQKLESAVATDSTPKRCPLIQHLSILTRIRPRQQWH